MVVVSELQLNNKILITTTKNVFFIIKKIKTTFCVDCSALKIPYNFIHSNFYNYNHENLKKI
ncbi:hypothetical protein GCM10022259_39970 [Aquimarina mytili]